MPGAGADVDVWILGSSAGESAEVAGARGLPFAANYHVSSSSVMEAVTAYRKAFQPSWALAEPYVAVSADVVVGPDDDTAWRLAAGYAAWVRSIRFAPCAPTLADLGPSPDPTSASLPRSAHRTPIMA